LVARKFTLDGGGEDENLSGTAKDDTPQTSIVIVAWNNIELTKMCVDSIRRYTEPGTYEIIIVNNGSTDGTAQWLKQQKDLKSISNGDNLGFVRGCNQGIKEAGGSDVLLLNNDTVVTRNWLANLRRCLYSSPDIGAVGAVTNYCSNSQAIPVGYKSLEEMHDFARQNNNSNPQRWEERLRLVGYCLLLKGEAVKKVGLLDERFSPGNYEDDDYSCRLLQAGYQLMLCHDVFIHHIGSATFRGDPAAYTALLKENGKKFEQKWGFNSTWATLIRHEIVQLMNDRGCAGINVLDIGCACGATLLYIKNLYKNAGLYGVEINKNAAEIAGSFAKVAAGDVESLELDYQEGFFDYIICADVLEQLKDPWQVLKKLGKYLKPGGRLLASLLNVMHYSVIRNLLYGMWTYQDGGIPGINQLRFFTIGDIINMFNGAGYEVLNVGRISSQISGEDEEFVKKLTDITGSKFADQYGAYQYVVRAGVKRNVPN